MTTILMTTVINDELGRYTRFSEKKTKRLVASVDRRDGKYYVYIGRVFPVCMAIRSSKSVAIAKCQRLILEFIPDAVFKWNVMQEHVKRA